MADIIDLDFYRNFRVVLPMYVPTKDKGKSPADHSIAKQRCKRRIKVSRPYTSPPSSQGEKDSL